MSEASSSIGRQRVSESTRVSKKMPFKHSYAVERGNRLRVGVRAEKS